LRLEVVVAVAVVRGCAHVAETAVERTAVGVIAADAGIVVAVLHRERLDAESRHGDGGDTANHEDGDTDGE
jgi:hypothetical protein